MTFEALAGGRAPRAWQRGMARAAAPLRALRRATAWVAELAGVRPTLGGDEPLLGRCFTELALQPFPSGETQKAAPREKERRRPEPPPLAPTPQRGRGVRPSGHRGAGRRLAFGDRQVVGEDGEGLALEERAGGEPREALALEGRTGRDPQEALTLESRADGELLARLAGPDGVSPGRTGGTIDAPEGRLRRDPHPLAPSPTRTHSRPGEGEAPRRDRTSHRVWLERLARRSGDLTPRPPLPSPPRHPGEGAPPPEKQKPEQRGLREEAPPKKKTAQPSGLSDSGGGAPSPGRWGGDGRGGQGVRSPWLLPLDGQTAPPELLEQWLRPVENDHSAPARTARPRSAPGSPADSPGAPRTPRPGASLRPPSRPSPLRNSLAPHQDGAPSPAPALEPLEGSPERQSRSEEVPDASRPLLAPPPSLPPFLRPRGTGDGDARRPGLAPEPILAPPRGPADTGEDLSALAAKIQRILDDEARRHGIPV